MRKIGITPGLLGSGGSGWITLQTHRIMVVVLSVNLNIIIPTDPTMPLNKVKPFLSGKIVEVVGFSYGRYNVEF